MMRGREKSTVVRKNKPHNHDNHTPDPRSGSQFITSPANRELLNNGSDVDEVLNEHPTTHTAASTAFEDEDGHHEAGKRDVDLYIRTYNTLLRSSGEVS